TGSVSGVVPGTPDQMRSHRPRQGLWIERWGTRAQANRAALADPDRQRSGLRRVPGGGRRHRRRTGTLAEMTKADEGIVGFCTFIFFMGPATFLCYRFIGFAHAGLC